MSEVGKLFLCKKLVIMLVHWALRESWDSGGQDSITFSVSDTSLLIEISLLFRWKVNLGPKDSTVRTSSGKTTLLKFLNQLSAVLSCYKESDSNLFYFAASLRLCV